MNSSAVQEDVQSVRASQGSYLQRILRSTIGLLERVLVAIDGRKQEHNNHPPLQKQEKPGPDSQRTDHPELRPLVLVSDLPDEQQYDILSAIDRAITSQEKGPLAISSPSNPKSIYPAHHSC